MVIVARGSEALELVASESEPKRGRPCRRWPWLKTSPRWRVGPRCLPWRVGRVAFRLFGHQRWRPAARDFRDWDPRGLDQSLDAEHAHSHRADQGHGGRHGRARLRAHCQHHFQRGEAPIDILGPSNGARSGLTGFVAGVARSRIASQGVTINNLLPASSTSTASPSPCAPPRRNRQERGRDPPGQQAQIPAGRYGTPEEFGSICAFLCSRHAAYLTGQTSCRTAAPIRAPIEVTRAAVAQALHPASTPGRHHDPAHDQRERQCVIGARHFAKKAADISAANSGVRLEKHPARPPRRAARPGPSSGRPARRGRSPRTPAWPPSASPRRCGRRSAPILPAAKAPDQTRPNTTCAIRKAAQSARIFSEGSSRRVSSQLYQAQAAVASRHEQVSGDQPQLQQSVPSSRARAPPAHAGHGQRGTRKLCPCHLDAEEQRTGGQHPQRDAGRHQRHVQRGGGLQRQVLQRVVDSPRRAGPAARSAASATTGRCDAAQHPGRQRAAGWQQASTQRRKFSVTGGISSCARRPTTALPAHSSGGIVSSSAVPGVSLWVMHATVAGAS